MFNGYQLEYTDKLIVDGEAVEAFIDHNRKVVILRNGLTPRQCGDIAERTARHLQRRAANAAKRRMEGEQ